MKKELGPNKEIEDPLKKQASIVKETSMKEKTRRVQ